MHADTNTHKIPKYMQACMYLHIYSGTQMHADTHACTHACVHLLMHMYTDICIHIYRNPCTHTNIYVHTTCIYTGTYISVQAYTYIQAYIHICMYTYMHTHRNTVLFCIPNLHSIQFRLILTCPAAGLVRAEVPMPTQALYLLHVSHQA